NIAFVFDPIDTEVDYISADDVTDNIKKIAKSYQKYTNQFDHIPDEHRSEDFIKEEYYQFLNLIYTKVQVHTNAERMFALKPDASLQRTGEEDILVWCSSFYNANSQDLEITPRLPANP